MSGKRNRDGAKNGFFSNNYWQSAAFNQRTFYKNLNWIYTLAINRFIWNGLPDTCNQRKLEETLLRHGIATIAKDSNGVWFSLIVGAIKEWNVYQEPAAWDVMGWNASKLYSSDTDSGVIVYDNKNKYVPHDTLELLARELTQCERTLQVNRAQQHVPVIISGKREQKQVLNNFANQTYGFEVAVIADESFTSNVKMETFKLDTPYLGNELWADRQNCWNEVYRFLGIRHLAFEKGERMIEQEAEANAEPAGLMAINELQTRQEAAEKLSEILGSPVTVEWNKDVSTYAYPDEILKNLKGDENVTNTANN